MFAAIKFNYIGQLNPEENINNFNMNLATAYSLIQEDNTIMPGPSYSFFDKNPDSSGIFTAQIHISKN